MNALNTLSDVRYVGGDINRLYRERYLNHDFKKTNLKNKGQTMNEIIKISKTEVNGAEVNSVNARELHEYLESKRQFSDWIKDKLDYVDAVENIDYIIVSQNCETILDNGGLKVSVKKDYIITLDIAKEFAMLERSEKGKKARRYFIEVEKAYQEQNAGLSEIDILINSAKLLKEHQLRVKAVENKTISLECKTSDIQKEQLKLKNNINRILTNDNYMTVIAYANLKGISHKDYHAPSIGKKAKKLSLEQGAVTGAVIDPRFGKINTYDVNILNQIF